MFRIKLPKTQYSLRSIREGTTGIIGEGTKNKSGNLLEYGLTYHGHKIYFSKNAALHSMVDVYDQVLLTPNPEGLSCFDVIQGITGTNMRYDTGWKTEAPRDYDLCAS